MTHPNEWSTVDIERKRKGRNWQKDKKRQNTDKMGNSKNRRSQITTKAKTEANTKRSKQIELKYGTRWRCDDKEEGTGTNKTRQKEWGGHIVKPSNSQCQRTIKRDSILECKKEEVGLKP